MTAEWQPISEAKFRILMTDQVSRLDDDLRPAWERYGLSSPVQIQCLRSNSDGSPAEPEPMFCVARDGARVLIYDDVEEDFGTGVLDADGVLRGWGAYGEELGWSLRPFVEGH